MSELQNEIEAAGGRSDSTAELDAELNRGGFPVKNASYWRRQYLDMQAMYDAQCQCTDELAAKYRAELERKGDEALLRRVKELEDALAVVNARLAASNVFEMSDTPKGRKA